MLRAVFSVLFLLLLPAAAQEKKAPAETPADELVIPERPDDFLYDETGGWPPDERKVAAAELNTAAVQLRLGLFLVNLKTAPAAAPEVVARRLALAWTGTSDRAVVLTAPGLAPVVVCAGETLGNQPAESLAAACATAASAGAKAPGGLNASLAAARSLIAQVNQLRLTGTLAPAARAPSLPAALAEQESDLTILWLALGAISLVLLLTAAFFMKRGQTSALIFPLTVFRRRFSAPHSGGNDAMISWKE